MDTIWLTGSGGFVGSYLARTLKERGYNTLCLTNLEESCGTRQSRDGKIGFNFESPESVCELIKTFGLPDVLVHAGWGSMADSDSEVHITKNVSASQNLIRIFFENGLKHFVFLGSTNEYGDTAGGRVEYMAPVGPLNNYSKGKIAVQKFGIIQAKHYDSVYTHIRLFNIFGSGQKNSFLINKLFECRRKKIAVDLAACDFYRDYIHVTDAVEGIIRLCALERSVIVNLGSGDAVKLRSFIELLWKHLGGNLRHLKFDAHPLPSGERPAPKSYADLTLLLELTGWAPKLSLEEGIIQTIQEFEKYESICGDFPDTSI